MPWCAEGELRRLWRESKVTDVRSGALVARAAYAGFDDLWSPFPTGVAPSGAFCAALDEDRRAAPPGAGPRTNDHWHPGPGAPHPGPRCRHDPRRHR
jgi:hypothetical protein